MRARETILISKQTGKEYRFSSTHEADKFLGRKKSYVTTRMAYNHKVSHNQTKEEFDVIIKGEKNHVTKQCIQSMQLCWDCKKAINGCNWSRCGRPVDGWTAEPTFVKLSTQQKVPSYKIMKCPEFEPG